MKIAIIERIENDEKEKPFNKRFYITNHFQEIFEKLDILWIPIVSEQFSEEICEICDGLLVTGSIHDVHPKYYHEQILSGKKYQYDEFLVVKKAVELFSKNNKPIFGICAGIQEINAVFGGTLNQQIENHNLKDQSKHKIEIKKNTFLYDVYNKDTIEVNSYHYQSVKDVAPNFKVAAVSSDGVIEAIEKENIIAVQWHPEVIHDLKLFEKFINMCKRK